MKNLSSPSPTKSFGISRSFSSSSITDSQQRFSSPKRFSEANENEQEQANSLKSQQKPKKMATKHFMSPTFSAASKAVVPRKKVLGERNEGSALISSDTHNHGNPVNDPNDALEDLGFDGLSVRSSQTTPLSSKVSEPDCDLVDPSSQPYDPFTNYLSPRPKYLRYNPNRRVEILHRRENERRKRGDEFGVDPNASIESQKLIDEGLIQSLSSSFEESSLKQGGSSPNADRSSPKPCCNGDNKCKNGSKENLEEVREEQSSSKASDSSSSSLGDGSSPSDDNLEPKPSDDEESADYEDDDDEVNEVEDEERHWNVKGVLKMLFLLLVSVLSMSYMSSTNSPVAAPSKAFLDLKEGYQKLQNHSSQAAMNNFMVSDMFFEQSLVDSDVKVFDEGMENDEMVGKSWDVPHQIGERLGILQEIAAEVSNSFQVSDTQMEELQYMDDMDIVAENMSTETEVRQDKEENKEDQAAESTSEHHQASTNAAQFEKPEVVPWNSNQVPSENVAVQGVAQEEEKVEHEVDSIEGLEDESAAATESWKLNQAPIEEFTNEGIGKEEMLGDELENTVEATNGIGETLRLQGREIGDGCESYKSLKFPLNEFTFNEIDDGFKNFSSEMDLQHSKSMRVHSISKLVMIGMSLLSVIVVSTALGFLHLKCKKTFSKGSTPITQQSLGAKAVEFKNSSLPKRANKIEKVESYVNPSSSVHSEGNGYIKHYQTQTPTVELLGEYVVGQFGSSLKRRSLESRPVESEASSFTCSHEKRPKRKGISSSNHEVSSVSDFSTAQSSSYGSFTTQEKILVKEGSRDGEESMKVITTPVRRSSRIASRAVTSP